MHKPVSGRQCSKQDPWSLVMSKTQGKRELHNQMAITWEHEVCRHTMLTTTQCMGNQKMKNLLLSHRNFISKFFHWHVLKEEFSSIPLSLWWASNQV